MPDQRPIKVVHGITMIKIFETPCREYKEWHDALAESEGFWVYLRDFDQYRDALERVNQCKKMFMEAR